MEFFRHCHRQSLLSFAELSSWRDDCRWLYKSKSYFVKALYIIYIMIFCGIRSLTLSVCIRKGNHCNIIGRQCLPCQLDSLSSDTKSQNAVQIFMYSNFCINFYAKIVFLLLYHCFCYLIDLIVHALLKIISHVQRLAVVNWKTRTRWIC